MTSDPAAPGAPAIILYRQVDRDDYGRTAHGGASLSGATADRFEEQYFRVKILTEEGRRFGNVEIPIFSGTGNVNAISARTIEPDGSIVNFSGQVFEKTIYKRKGVQFLAKTFSMPEVRVGSVLEYYFTITFREGYIFFSQWVLSNELFTKKAKFTLRPYQNDISP